MAESAARAQSALRVLGPMEGGERAGALADPRVGADATSSDRAGALHPPERGECACCLALKNAALPSRRCRIAADPIKHRS